MTTAAFFHNGMSDPADDPGFPGGEARKKSIFNFRASANRNPSPAWIVAVARRRRILTGKPDLYFTRSNGYCFATAGHFVFFI
jgi:hypothetical protein